MSTWQRSTPLQRPRKPAQCARRSGRTLTLGSEAREDPDVPPLSQDTLRGYVLEEVLARLIQNTGYRLLVDATQDVEELENRPNGLAVRGRGGSHQVDVLGELLWIPAFTFPLRLIVEAKARKGTTGIGDVRNAVGVVSDVNQNYTRTSGARRVLIQKYSYRYAVLHLGLQQTRSRVRARPPGVARRSQRTPVCGHRGGGGCSNHTALAR